MPRFSLAPGLVTFYSIYLDTETLLSLEDHLCSASVRIGTSLPSVLCSFCLHIFWKLTDTDQQSRTSVSHGGSRAVSAIVQAKHDYWTRGRSFKNVWWFKRSVWCDFIQAQSQIATAEELNVSSSVMREKWRFETDWLSYGCNAEQPRQHEEGMAVCGHCGSYYLKWMHVCLYANGAQTLLPILHGGHLLKLKTRSIMTLSVINIWPVKVSYLGRIRSQLRNWTTVIIPPIVYFFQPASCETAFIHPFGKQHVHTLERCGDTLCERLLIH